VITALVGRNLGAVPGEGSPTPDTGSSSGARRAWGTPVRTKGEALEEAVLCLEV
jgi:hypothetical protein